MDDVYERILINLDINTLQNACRTNKYHNICNDFNFWIQKFKYDDVPILALKLPTTATQWIKEYKKVNNIILQVDDIVDNIMENGIELVIEHENIFGNTNLKDKTLFYLLPQELLQYDPEYYNIASVKMLKTKKNVELIFYEDYHVHGVTTLTFDQFKFMLVRLIYYIPKLRLQDSKHYISLLDF